MNEFDLNLARVLACTIVHESNPYGVSLQACGGSTMVQNTGESMDSVMDAIVKHYPTLLGTINKNIIPFEQGQLAASQAVSPGYQQLQSDLYKQFAPDLAKTASQIEDQTAKARAASDLDILSGTGQGLIKAVTSADEAANPEYYAARKAMGGKLAQLADSFDVDKLSGGERAEIERANAAKYGTTSPNNAADVAGAAMNFGQALNAKRAAVSQALSQGLSTVNGLKSNIDVGNVALGRPSTSQAMSSTQLTGLRDMNNSQAFGQMNSLMGQTGQSNNMYNQGMLAQQNSNNQLKSMMINNAMTAGGATSSCCFIFLQAQNGLLPDFVRWCRDNLADEQTRKGYRRMAKWLVPLMERFAFVQDLVNAVMVEPLIKYGAWLTCQPDSRSNYYYRPYVTFWFRVWKTLGR